MEQKLNIRIKIPKQIHVKMLDDLRRQHPFAYERVGLLYTTSKQLMDNTILVLAKDYVPVDDNNYIKDRYVGAKINSNAIRTAMQRILENKEGCFHVHLHEHKGVPSPSFTDNKGLLDVVRSFGNISQDQVNGMLILSENSFYATVKLENDDVFHTPEIISVVGYPFNMHFPLAKRDTKKKTFDRQSFLGKASQRNFENVKVGIVGYGGGGSHIGQQLAHLGVTNMVVFDDDKVEDTNLNRLIGAWFSDAKKEMLKVLVANRLIKKILPTANVKCINSKWQQNPELLQSCDVVFGCVDSYSQRQQLEAECRRYLIPYIDVGMDVHKHDEEQYSVSGQTILSMPGSACMSCYGFITKEKLALEAEKYGNAGNKPQVVWANGVLASTAIGIFVDLCTDWTKFNDKLIYLSYDGNSGTMVEHVRAKFVDKVCNHYRLSDIGIPIFKKI